MIKDIILWASGFMIGGACGIFTICMANAASSYSNDDLHNDLIDKNETNKN